MTLLWPLALAALLPIPVLIGLYVWTLRRRRPALRYSTLTLFRDLAQRPPRRRHVPFGLFAVAIAVLAIGAARPAVELPVPVGTSAMILAIDTSASMCGDRLVAAKQGAAAFALRHAPTRKVGIVAFHTTAGVAALPTNDTDTLIAAVDMILPRGGTNLGLGILESIDAIAENNPRIPTSDVRLSTVPDEYAADVIVVLSDGASDSDPRPAAQAAAARGIRIYPVAYTMPAGRSCSLIAAPDSSTLQAVADLTGGEYREAGTEAELDAVFDELPTYLWVEDEQVEISVAFAAIGGLLAAASVLLGRWWAPLP